MTRSGVVQSVHAFGEDRALAWMFTGFMIVTLVVSFGLLIYRMPLLRARNDLDSWVSREAAFVANNWVLLFAAFFVLFATMFPTLSEALTGERLTVGPPVFNKWLTPVGLILLALTGIGPLLAWRKSTSGNLRQQFLWPVLAGILTGVGTTYAGLPFWATGLCFALCSMVTVTILQEFVRGALVRRQATGTDVFTALVGLFARSKRRYGGYIVHLGIVLIFLGFAGNGFERDERPELRPGQQFTLAPYRVQYNGLKVTEDANKQMVTADFTVWRNGKEAGHLYPARWYFFGHEDEPTTEVALRRTPPDDLYLVLTPDFDAATQRGIFMVRINPLVNWIWLGVGIMVVGTGIAFLPERAIVFAAGRIPSEVVTTSLLIGALVLGLGGTARAQSTEPAPRMRQTTALGRQLENELMCLCGGCHAQLGSCPMAPGCSHWQEEEALLTQYLDAGMTHDQIVAAFVKKYGSQEVLASPIDRGFNRLLWALPYAAGALGIVLVGGLAVRWTRRHGTEDAEPLLPDSVRDPALDDRLDDELRELD
jgi:cytochrome c-type biogenesis protein CcmF